MRCFQNTIKCVLPTAAASGWHSLLHCQMHNQWGLCEYVIAHTNLPPSPVILRIEMVAKPAKRAVSRYSVIFCALLREQKMAAACASVMDISSVSRTNSFTAQTELRKCRFPRLCLVAAIIFPHTKWLPKITDYRDTTT